MQIIGMVTRSETVEKGDKEYINFSIEGLSLIPSKNLNGKELPHVGEYVKTGVSVYYRKGEAPLHFLESWHLA